MISRSHVKTAILSLPQPVRAALRLGTIRPLRSYIRFAPWTLGKARLYDGIAGHLWWLETRVLASTRFGATLDVDASDIVGKHIYYFGVWEPTLTAWISKHLKPGDTFIDVGANVGYYSLLASRLVGATGKVVSVEALPAIHRVLTENLERNHADNARVVNAAAWDKVEMVQIFARPEHPAGTTTLMHEWATQWQLARTLELEAKPLAMILRPEEIQIARMMKIDVEGAEFRVISEMTTWLGQTRDTFEVVVEVARSMLASQGKRLEDLLQLFERFGFHAYRIENDYRAESCIYPGADTPPQRIRTWPDDQSEQVDLIFSRRNAETL